MECVCSRVPWPARDCTDVFGCVFPLCVIFKGGVFYYKGVLRTKSCSCQKGDITEPLLQRKIFVRKVYM